MENKHANMTKGFTQLSKAWYGEASLRNVDYVDEVVFGFYYSDGGTTGEMVVQWINLDGKIVPELTIFSDGWSALAQLHDLIDLLGQHDGEDSTPEQFCKFLLECGFIDKTETIRNYRRE